MVPLEKVKGEVVELLLRTGRDHHRAYAATDGEDPDWPIWYADYLQKPLSELLGTELNRSRIVYCLMNSEYERETRAPDAGWAPYYADHFLEHFAPTETATRDRLALYQFRSCPFCVRVRAVIEKLGLDVELRDIHEDAGRWEELVEARGRATVPVLKIDSPDGTEHWMPESADIIRYLEKTYG